MNDEEYQRKYGQQEIVLGDYVRTKHHGHIGRVTDVHITGCPEGAAWLMGQEISVTQYKDDPWVSVLVHPKGAVVAPAALCERVDPFPFENPWAGHYFRPDEAPNVQIIHSRDPDSECGLTVFVNGVNVPAVVEDIDPGRGYDEEDIRERRDEADARASRPDATEFDKAVAAELGVARFEKFAL